MNERAPSRYEEVIVVLTLRAGDLHLLPVSNRSYKEVRAADYSRDISCLLNNDEKKCVENGKVMHLMSDARYERPGMYTTVILFKTVLFRWLMLY